MPAVSRLAARVLTLLSKSRPQTLALEWLERSLAHPEAKVWIHQGHWLRMRRVGDRNLRVVRWTQAELHHPMQRVWATLTSADEPCITLTGAPCTLGGDFLSKPLKPDRAMNLHERGYT